MVKKEEALKRARILLRVSSNQQLDADGDLNVQRQLVLDYIYQHEDLEIDLNEFLHSRMSMDYYRRKRQANAIGYLHTVP